MKLIDIATTHKHVGEVAEILVDYRNTCLEGDDLEVLKKSRSYQSITYVNGKGITVVKSYSAKYIASKLKELLVGKEAKTSATIIADTATVDQASELINALHDELDFVDFKEIDTMATIVVKLSEAVETDKTFRDATIKARYRSWQRIAIDLPPNILTPKHFTAMAIDLVKSADHKSKVKTNVLKQSDLEELGCGLLLAVAKGSKRKPRMLTMLYRGDKENKDNILGLVGKGITYDTGGSSLKPNNYMADMKSDMAGAASAIAAFAYAVDTKVKANIALVVPISENRLAPDSVVPDDVVSALDGTTVEIRNTDAEGRLIMADALVYAQKFMGATRIIDLTTLTSTDSFLGDTYGMLISNNQDLAAKALKVSNDTGDLFWQMPLHEDFDEAIKCPIADLRNSAFPFIPSAVAFLKHFIKVEEWLHLEVSTVSFKDKKATGRPMKFLLEFIKDSSAETIDQK